MSIRVEVPTGPSTQTPAPLPPQLRRSLPGRYYTDPAQFERDRESVFTRSWLCVARSDEVTRPGGFLRVPAAGRDVLLVRGRDGVLRGFHNLCRHRGAALCLEQQGSFRRAIRCMYHAWTYDLDGRLIAAPNAEEMPDLPKEQFGLVRLAVEEWLGYAWVNLEAAAASLREQVEPQVRERLGDLDTLARYDIGSLRVGRSIEYDVASNWKCVVENFMECYHCASIHPELVEALPQFASGWGTVSSGVGAGARFADDLDGFSMSRRAVRPRLPGLLESDDRVFHGVVLRPNAFLILVPDHVAFFRMEPLAAGRTKVVVDWLFDAGEVAKDGFDCADSVRLLDVTNRQDFEACQRCQIGMASPEYRGVLVPSEHVVLDFHDYYLGRLGRSAADVDGP
jgi:phenylpropionate dioxygenase-like ring-hydroxylating dioxygenase large terminal subunit